MIKRKIFMKRFEVNGKKIWVVSKFYGLGVMNSFIFYNTNPVKILKRNPWLYEKISKNSPDIEIEVSEFLGGSYWF